MKILRITQIDPYSEVFTTWWNNKVQNAPNPQTKLDRYLTAMGYYNQFSYQFWGRLAFNITMDTQESIVTSLTRLGDFIRLSGIDCPLAEEYFKVAEKVARSDALVATIKEHMQMLWPTGMNIMSLHYKKVR